MRLLPLAVLVLLAGCAAPLPAPTASSGAASPTTTATTTTAAQACPGHWHATFAVYLPGPGGAPTLLDMATPRGANGRAYYDLGGSPAMGLAIHMHQSGAERGNASHGPTQWHYEKDGTCVTVQESLRAIEVDATATGLHVHGGHAQAGQARHWEANATAPLRWFTQTDVAGAWTWQERAWDQLKATQLPDGASLLVALGAYTDAQVEAMQASVPAPISRPVA